jgi:hypothetical protein
MYPNVGRDWTNQDWIDQFTAYRQAAAETPRIAPVNNEALCLALQSLSAIVGSYRNNIRDFDDIIADAVWGREGRKGLLEAIVELSDVPANPKAWAVKSLTNRLIDALRRQRHTADADVTEAIGERTMAGRPVMGVAAFNASPHSATAVPRQVAKSLHEVVRFSALAIELVRASPANAADLGLGEVDPKAWAKAATKWATLADCLSRDVDLGPGRLRWQHQGVDATDNSARAWQNTFHLDQGHEDYVDDGERPTQVNGPAGNLYYQHLKRFREAYAAASGHGCAVVEGAAKTGVGGVDARTRSRHLPLEWEPAEHPTLVSNRTPGERDQ